MLRKIDLKQRMLASVLSSGMLIATFPDLNLEFLAWIAFIPLFFAIDDLKPRESFLVSYAGGVIFFLGTIYWLIHVTLPGMIAVVLYLAVYFGLFGALFSYISSAVKKRSVKNSRYLLFILAPSLWVSMELLRSNILSGFGWVLISHSQSYNLPVIQISDITGAYGVTFLVVMVNMAVFLTIKEVRAKKYDTACLAAALFILFISISYGVFRMRNVFTGESIRVAVIQGNIPQDEKWNPNLKEHIISKYEKLTLEAAKNSVDLVIWPETSVPGFLEDERDLFDRVRDLAVKVNSSILVGTVRQVREGDLIEYYNSAVIFSNEGRVAGDYDKMHLVPFGEYIPFRAFFSFVEKFAPVPIGDCTPGKDYKVFSFFIERKSSGDKVSLKWIKKIRFASLICFEDIFPDIAREFVNRGAMFLVNITNDAWYKYSSAPYQHAQNSIFRAVENRVNVVRAANTGFSCFIDQRGKITEFVRDQGKDIFVDGYAVQDIVLTRTRTLYARYGDIFAYACVIYVLLCLTLAFNDTRHRASS